MGRIIGIIFVVAAIYFAANYVTESKIAVDGEWLFPMTIASAQTFNGQPIAADVSAASDNPADLLTDAVATANDIIVGTGVQYVSSSSGWVDIGTGARRIVGVTA